MNGSSHSARRLLGVGAVASTAGTLVNAGIYGVGRSGHVAYVMTRTAHGARLIHLSDVANLSIMSFAAGFLVLGVVARFGRPSLRALGILASLIAVASTSMDLALPSTVAARTSLAAMHIVVGVAYVTALRFVESAPRIPAVRPSGAPILLEAVAA